MKKDNQNIPRQKNADVKGYFAYQKCQLHTLKINKLIFLKNFKSVVSKLGVLSNEQVI